MSQYADQYLEAMGIKRWVLRERPQAEALPAEEAELVVAAQPVSAVAEQTVTQTLHDWSGLRDQVLTCTRCELHQSRKQAVFGVGNQSTDLLVIGEAPGADEDAQGEPFVGRAGKLLNAMLLAIGFAREQVFIANILKCRPPNNRDPRPEEVAQCIPYLRSQIDFIKPKVILAVGRIAAQNLLQTEETIGRLRGTLHSLPEVNIPMVVTYHPAYLLRKPIEKRKSWQDLQLAYKALQEA